MEASLALFPSKRCFFLMALTSIDHLLVFLFGGCVVSLSTVIHHKVLAIGYLGQVCGVELASFFLATITLFY
jgi:hypothetical protein